MIRACDGHRGHGEGGCGWRTSGLREAAGDACPLCGGALVEAQVPAPPAPRRPVAGWAGTADRMVLRVGAMRAVAIGTKRPRWDVTRHINARHEAPFSVVDEGDAPTLEAAQLAAEDALLAVLTDAAAALGKRVVS